MTERRRAARANFRTPPSFWADIGGEVYEARCMNISKVGISVRVNGLFRDLQPGEQIEAALTAPRICVVASATVIRAQMDERGYVVAAAFDNPPNDLEDLIHAAVACIDDGFHAGSITTNDTHLVAEGAFSHANEGDLRYGAPRHAHLNMNGVREIDEAGMALLEAAHTEHQLKLLNCRSAIAVQIRTKHGKTLCSDECPHCPAEH